VVFPIDRTALIAAQTNQVPNALIRSALNIAAIKTPYDTIDELYNYTANLVAGGVLQPYPAFLSRQALINGNFDVWQRGTTFTNPVSGTYTTDRFAALYSTVGALPTSIVHSQQSLTPGDIVNSFYYYRISPNGSGSGFGVGDGYYIQQKIENGVRYLCGVGKNITISFWARSDITGKKIGIYAFQKYGTGGSPSTGENIAGNKFSLTSTWTKYTVTITTNTLVGKTFGTNNDDFLGIQFVSMWGTGTFGTLVSSAGVAETFGGAGNIDIAQVQVNSGATALLFQPRSFAEELALCQRYYEKSYSYATAPLTASAAADSIVLIVPSNTIAAGQAYGTVAYKVRKRVTNPTITIYPYTTPSNTSRVSTIAGVDLGANSGVAQNFGDNAFQIVNNSGGTLTTNGNATLFHYVSDAEI
jgi:hypothetical protein